MNTIDNLIFSTAYFPPIEYMALMSCCQNATIEQHETWLRQTYRNRCRIMTANGLLDLSIPVNKPDGNHTLSSHIEISYQTQWQKQHQRSIISAYQNAPYFIYYFPELEFVFNQEHHKLFDLNNAILKKLFSLLKLRTNLNFTQSFEKQCQAGKDFRYLISPKNKGSWPPETYQPIQYYQTFSDRHGFVPGLSILDLLFNEGPQTLGYLTDTGKRLLKLYQDL